MVLPLRYLPAEAARCLQLVGVIKDIWFKLE